MPAAAANRAKALIPKNASNSRARTPKFQPLRRAEIASFSTPVSRRSTGTLIASAICVSDQISTSFGKIVARDYLSENSQGAALPDARAQRQNRTHAVQQKNRQSITSSSRS